MMFEAVIFSDEEEKPGWVWLLTVKGPTDTPEPNDIDDENFGESFVGCYATKPLMLDAMKKMGDYEFGMIHTIVEGWKE